MMKKFLYLFFALFFWLKAGQADISCEKANSFMGEIGEKVILLLTDNSISDQERAKQFREVLETKFNGKAIGKFVLGRYWKQASKKRKKDFWTFSQKRRLRLMQHALRSIPQKNLTYLVVDQKQMAA